MPESGAPNHEKTKGRMPRAAGVEWRAPETLTSPPAPLPQQTPARNSSRLAPFRYWMIIELDVPEKLHAYFAMLEKAAERLNRIGTSQRSRESAPNRRLP